MRPAVRDRFLEFTAPLEGVVRWMYLDVKGLVTTGYGNLIDSIKTALEPEWSQPDGSRATRGDVIREWNKVKSNVALAKQGHLAAERVTKLRLSDEAIEKLVFRVLDTMNAELVKAYPNFEAWPADAQLATLAMAWACGPAFRWSFRSLDKSLRAEDWKAASQQCTISARGNPGVIPRSRAMKQLYFLAAALPCDGEELHWPADEQVRQWQAQRGLVPDGNPGPKTLGAL
jgi:GH24 family phage-related lysozyme (muramidase)